MVKITDLPLYPVHPENEISVNAAAKNTQANPNQIEPYVTKAREEIETFLGPQFNQSFKRLEEIISTSKAHTYELIQQVQDRENQAVRATFITSAAFIGYLLGRRGFFKRVFFAMILGGSAAAICEPQMAKDYAEVALELSKKRIKELYEELKNSEFIESIKLPSLFSPLPSMDKDINKKQ